MEKYGICKPWVTYVVLFVFVILVVVGAKIVSTGITLIENRINQQSEVFNAFK